MTTRISVLTWISFGLPCYCLAQADQAKAPTGVFSGRLVDEDDEPVTDAVIALQGPGHYQTHTDKDGKFNFLDAIEAGQYRLSIKSQKWVGITDYRQMPIVILDPENPTTKNFTLDRAFQFELQVVDDKGDPVRASVYYRPLAGDRFRNADRTTTDGEGTANVGGLASSNGKYIVGVSSKAHAFGHLIVEASDPGQIVRRKIVLQPGRTIKGKAVCSDGLPPAGWSLYALPTWWNFGSYPGGVKIEEDGSFELPHIGRDRQNLLIFIPEGNGISTSRAVLSDANLHEMDEPIQVTLDYPSPKSMNYLTGTVRWIGKPLEGGLSISGYCAELQHHTSYHLEPGKTGFKIGPVPKGTYRIRVDNPELEVMNLRKIKNLNDLDHVKIPNEKPLQLVLRVRGKPHVQGIVVDAETQEPITTFRYRVTKVQTLSGPNYVEDDHWRLGKDAMGRFQSDVVGPGVYLVSVLADKYAIQTSPQVNTDDQPDEVLKFELRPGVSLRGRVVDADGNPLSGATVRALSLTAGAMPRVLDRFVTMEGAVKTQDGFFELKNLQPGRESIRVDHPEFTFKEIRDIELNSQLEPLTVQLSKGAKIQGTVFDAEGKPQANELLLFQDDYAYGGGDREAGRFGQAVTDEHGHYEMDCLPETIVYVSRSEEWSASGVVRHAVFTKEGETHPLNLGGTRQLSGQYFVNDQPLSDTRLQLGGDDSIFGAMKMYAQTDDAGHFVFHGAPAGHWNIYRAFDGRGSNWVKIREVDVPADQGLDLGEIRSKSGKLTVQCETTASSLPENLRMNLRQYSPRQYFGRSAAALQPRETPNDPFVFLDVSPGDYELACYGAGTFAIVQRMRVTDKELDSTITFPIPSGHQSLTIELLDQNGDPLDQTFMLVSEDGRLLRYFYSQADQGTPGTYTATDLPAGKYTLRRGNARDAEVISEIELKDGEENKFLLKIPKQPPASQGYARLLISDQHGVFVPCAVAIKEESGQEIKQYQGKVELTLTGPPGSYTVQIDHPGFEPVEQTVQLRSSPLDSNTIGQRIRLELRPRRIGEP